MKRILPVSLLALLILPATAFAADTDRLARPGAEERALKLHKEEPPKRPQTTKPKQTQTPKQD